VEFVDEGKVINDYGATLPDEYGGVYRDELMNLVALFTGNLERHEAALKARLPVPERLRVAQAARTLREVDAATEDIRGRLKRDRPDLKVYVVGNTVRNGRFVTLVYLDTSHGDDGIRAVEQIADPYRVSVMLTGPFRALGTLGTPRTETR
jgi:hypothetical protein